MMKKPGLVLSSILLCSFMAMAKGDPQAGAKKAVTCAACHGDDGKATAPIYPTLAGQSENYLAHALHAYKNGERHGGQAEIMRAYVSSLSDEDIANLAAWYSSQKE